MVDLVHALDRLGSLQDRVAQADKIKRLGEIDPLAVVVAAMRLDVDMEDARGRDQLRCGAGPTKARQPGQHGRSDAARPARAPPRAG